MNTPDPNVARDPTTPGARARPTAAGAGVASVVTGTPLAIVSVWLIEAYGTVHGQPIKLDTETAVAFGSVGAGIAGYLWQVAQGLWEIVQERLTRP